MPQTPQPVSGHIYLNGVAVNGATVKVYNLNNGSEQTETTGADGAYLIDLANSGETYEDNDPILIRAYKTDKYFKFAEVLKKVDTSTGSIEQDLSLGVAFPKQPKDVEIRHLGESEHDPVENAKRVVPIGDPLDKYKPADRDTTGDLRYYGSTDKDGNWVIRMDDASVNQKMIHRYARGSSDYAANWNKRVTLTYKRFDELF